MCQYPIRILPQKRYVKNINIDELNEHCKKSFLVRRLAPDENPFHNIGGQKLLKEGVIKDDVLDWSTNLLGGEFKVEDIQWKQEGEGCSYWKGEEINIADYEGCYTCLESVYPVFIAIGKLHKMGIPYKRKFGQKSDVIHYAEDTHDLTKEDVEQWTPKEDPQCHATITVEHKPTKLNYWHMTVEITPLDFKEPMDRNSKRSKSLKDRVKKALHAHIVKNVQCKCTEIESIPEPLYIK